MIYLYVYVGVFLLLVVGYMIGVRDERRHGAAAAQKASDIQTAAYYTQKEVWDVVEGVFDAPMKKQSKQYGHLRLIK